jgi:glyoxylase-like metal-dependent hydrolase (beta-lactamase superfamily II)
MISATLETQLNTFTTAGGAQIFQLPLLVFPRLWGYAYLVLVEGEGGPYRVLIDAGSGFGEADRHLEAGMAAVSERLGYLLTLVDLTHVLVTHGHIDHFGGLAALEEAGAHVEYLYQRGLLGIENLEEVERAPQPLPVHYRCLPCKANM